MIKVAIAPFNIERLPPYSCASICYACVYSASFNFMIRESGSDFISALLRPLSVLSVASYLSLCFLALKFSLWPIVCHSLLSQLVVYSAMRSTVRLCPLLTYLTSLLRYRARCIMFPGQDYVGVVVVVQAVAFFYDPQNSITTKCHLLPFLLSKPIKKRPPTLIFSFLISCVK